jgi:NAD kinase
MEFDKAILIRDKTRLEQLVDRFNSKAQAAFYLERAGQDIRTYEQEHDRFYDSLDRVRKSLNRLLRTKVLFRTFVPAYIFGEHDLIVVLGQDGLVANTAKYAGGLPILGVNPEKGRYDGILLPYGPDETQSALEQLSRGKCNIRPVSMAEARLSDGQRLLAFNDLFIGAATHVSARYRIAYNDDQEEQSSSGIIVSTGAGSTGWLSSVFNMAWNITRFYEPEKEKCSTTLRWEDERLAFVVREPFVSRSSKAGIGFGFVDYRQKLLVESHMATNGIIFSDGIESDFLQFNAGSSVEIRVAAEKARLIVPSV